MFCKKCGKEINDQASICPHCGQATDYNPVVNSNDSGSFGWGLLGFIWPLIGLILYLVWKESKPKTSRIAGKGALIGFIVSFVLGFVGGFIIGLLGLNMPV